MGTNKDQARSLVANVPNPYYYELRFDLDAIPSERILRLEDMNWLEFLEMEFPLEETEQGDVTISYAEAGWIGFVYRHLHFATGLASSELVKKVPFDNLLIGYAGLHTVDEDMAVEILSEDFGLPMVKETEG